MARTVLGQISRSFHYRDKKTFVKLLITYVRPHLEFCTPAWSPWTVKDIDCIEKVQKKMVNMVSGLQATTYEGKLSDVGLESLETRRRNADIHTMHKLVHGVRARSDALNVKSKNGTLELRRNFFTMRIVKDWNSVPAEIKNISVPGKFKAELKRWQDGGRIEMQRRNNAET
jgi:hypothetical protein